MATVRALECLLAIAETGSLTAAASRLHLTQPSLSHQVRMLEQEIGTAVLDRLPRGVRLTAAGTAMLEPARSGVLAVARAVASGRAVAGGEAGLLRVACAESMTAGLLAPALMVWRRQHPDVGVELTERLSVDQLATDVLLGNVDLAIGPAPSPSTLEPATLLREEFRVVTSPDHPFAQRGSVTLAELADQPFVHLDPANGLAGWLDAVAAGASVVLRPVIRVRTTATVTALAAAGLGIGLVPDNTPRTHQGAWIPLNPPLTREVVAMHHAPAQPLVHAFCEILQRPRVPVEEVEAGS